VQRIDNPHFYNIINSLRYFTSNGSRMPMNPFNNQPLPFIKTNAYIAHYYMQSEEEHIRRKGRTLDDGSSNKTNLYSSIHGVHNAVVNNQLQNKYSQSIKLFLKKYNIEL